MNQARQNRTAQIEERAARYLARRQEGKWSAEDEGELDVWLRESTLHEVAYLRMECGWGKVDRVVVLKGGMGRPLHPALSPVDDEERKKKANWNEWLAIAAAVAVGAAVLFIWSSGWVDALRYDRYITGIGGHQTVPLTDGSRIELNTNTRVRADLSETTRTVWLDHGEAYFDIAQDPSRPFVVYAGERRVTVLGTKFSVRYERDSVRVAVTEGKVQLDDIRSSQFSAPRVMKDGDTATAVEDAPASVVSTSTEHVARELSWRQGMLTFDQTTLAAAAAEFNRYNRRQLVIADTAADVRIGGSFEATNVDAFVRLLREGFGLKAADVGSKIAVSN